jgi:hypothetical protein
MSQLGGVPYAFARTGKPLNNSDYITIIGNATAVAGSGPSASVTVVLAGSLSSILIYAEDIAANAQLNQGVGPELTPTGGVNAGNTQFPLSNTANPSQTLNSTNFPNGIPVTIPAQIAPASLPGISGYGPSATISATLSVSGLAVTVLAEDIAASQETL